MAVMMGGLVFWMWWKGWLTGVISGRRMKLPFRKEMKEREERGSRKH
jgi:hypothetical protein